MQPNKETAKLFAGTSFLMLGSYLFFICPELINYSLDSLLVLKPDGVVFKLWKRFPVPYYFEFYLFNWTNPEDIYSPNIKPRFEEIGPIIFEELRDKVNITWNDNDTVTFRYLRYWHFDESRSAVNLSAKIVTLNVLTSYVTYFTRFWSYIWKASLDFTLQSLSQQVHTETSIGEFIFQGYNHIFVDMRNALPFASKLPLPYLENFRLLLDRNGSAVYDGIFNSATSGERVGGLQEWNYLKTMPYYHGKCNEVKGSLGEFYPRNLKRDKIFLFLSDVCKAVQLDYSEDVIFNGTIGYKYILGDSFFDNGTKINENSCCFAGESVPSGVFNLSSCRYGAPVFISMPHFYGADPYYLREISGLHPKRELHEMFIIIEPTTGIPLHTEGRLQVNVLLQPLKDFSMYEKVPRIYFPIGWAQMKASIPPFLHIYLKVFLYMPMVIKCLAGVMLLLGIYFLPFICHCKLGKLPRWTERGTKAYCETLVNYTNETQLSLINCRQ